MEKVEERLDSTMPKISLFLDVAARALSSSPLPCSMLAPAVAAAACMHRSKRQVGQDSGFRVQGTGDEKRKMTGNEHYSIISIRGR